MRNLKKFLALVLALMMAMSLMVTANAEHIGTQYPDADKVTAEFTEAVEVLTGMGVFQGDDGNFEPARNVTRAEVAELIYRLYSGDVAGTQEGIYAKYGNFADVAEDAWYAGAVGYCANNGLIKGRTATTFDPRGNVTGYEVLAMILRAVGYDKNGEFTGTDWQVNVSTTAQQQGILKNISTTQYGGTLYGAARRDVVAELLFQTVATVPQVNYTAAFGYQQYGNIGGVTGSVKNDTLGYKVFGLTCNTGVVIGNEVTGEAKGLTKIGFSLDSRRTNEMINVDQYQGNIATGYNNSTASFYTVINDKVSAADDNGWFAYLAEPVNGENGLPMNVVRTFKWDTDLTQFNHAVKVWYNNNSSKTVALNARMTDVDGNVVANYGTAQFTTELTTYAVFDQSTGVSVVALEEGQYDTGYGNQENPVVNDGDLNGDLGKAARGTVDSVHNNWEAPNFKLNSYGRVDDRDNLYAAYFNYSFGPIYSCNYAEKAEDALSAVSPVLKNGETADSEAGVPYGLYLLISNTEGKVLDVVIPLEMTVSQVTQINNTSAPKSVGILTGNERTPEVGQNDNYFDTYDTEESSNGKDYAEIAQANLRHTADNIIANDAVTKAVKVAAIAITGTAGPNFAYHHRDFDNGVVHVALPNARDTDPTKATFGVSSAAGENYVKKLSPDAEGAQDLESQFYYQLTEPQTTKTGKVVSINPNNQTITFDDGSTLKQSIYAESVDATFTTNMEGVNHDILKDNGAYSDVLVVGKDYTFTLDEKGNYIFWEVARNTGNFMYATYIDFDTAVASSSFNYPVVYVDGNGNGWKTLKKTFNATSINDLTGNASLSAARYDSLVLNKRDHNPDEGTVGNDAGYRQGFYIGYAYNGDSGKLEAIGKLDMSSAANMRSTLNNDQYTDYYQASDANFGAAKIEITQNDVNLNAKRIPTENPNLELFLTNNTVFYVVDGAGTDNQKVDTYTGIGALREAFGGTTTINVTDDDSKLKQPTTYLDGTDNRGVDIKPWDMVYYKLDMEKYAQDYLGSAYYIEAVFVPRVAISGTADAESNTAYFIGDNTQTNVSAIGGDYTEFEFYNSDGELEKLWVDGHIHKEGTSAYVINQLGQNVFYNLAKTGTVSAVNKDCYSVRNITAENAQKTVIGEYYTGYDADAKTYGLDSALTTGKGDPAKPFRYAPTTTNSQVAYIDFYPVGRLNESTLWNVADVKLVNLNTAKYPGITADRYTLDLAGSLIDNDGVEVSCFLSSTTSVKTIFVNANETNFDLGGEG